MHTFTCCRFFVFDFAKVKKYKRVIVGADKSDNFYRMEKEKQKELLLKAIHATYMRGNKAMEEEMNQDAKAFAIQLDLEDRVFRTERREALFTLKDHKDNFANNPEVRLLNPTKPELGRVSKQILAPTNRSGPIEQTAVSYTQLRAHET